MLRLTVAVSDQIGRLRVSRCGKQIYQKEKDSIIVTTINVNGFEWEMYTVKSQQQVSREALKTKVY